jgi:hypothetical protein
MRLIERNDARIAIELTDEELKTVNNALNEILHGPEAIDEPEFHTRVGVSRDEAERLLASAAAILSG